MTRECDLRKVNFIDAVFKKYQFHKRIPHVVYKTFPELEVVEDGHSMAHSKFLKAP